MYELSELHQLLLLIISITISYSIGCLNSAYYLTRFITRKDIRTEFSSTAGATNTGRILGRYGFLAVLLIDVIRGAAGVLVGTLINGSSDYSGILLFFTVLGHIHPLQLRLRGGKGVACLIGGVYVIALLPAVFFIALFGLFFVLTRRKTLSGLLIITTFPLALFFLDYPPLTIIPIAAATTLILITYWRMSPPALPDNQ